MDGLESYTELLSRFGVPGSTRFAETSYGIEDGAGCSGVGFAGSESSYGIEDGAGCSGVGFAGSESSYGIDEGAGCSGVGFTGSDCYFDDGASDSSGSGFSSDSSDPEEEDDRDELEGAVDLDAAVDVAHDEEDNIPADGHYVTACEELAKEMREAAAAPPPRLFVPKENAFYIKRKRTAKGVELPTGRPPSEVGAIEAALRASVKKKKSEIFYPTPGTVFDSIEEAHEFYNLYSWEVGFGIKYGRSNKNKGNDYRTMQQFECADAGKDTRCVYQSQRSGCGALMKLFRTEDHGWYVSQLVTEHNHQLSECCGEKRQWKSHRAIDGYTKDMIRNLRENNVSLSKVHTILGSLHGGVQELPYTKRSIRTICAQIARDQLDDDVKKTLEEFRKMRQDDPNFAFSVDLDALNRVKTQLDAFSLCRNLMKMVDKTDAVEALRTWVKHNQPTELAITCSDLRIVFSREGRYTVLVVDGLTRCYQIRDRVMYANSGVPDHMWRHWMPASFATAVVDGEDFLSPRFRDMFVGEHLGYNIANCRMLYMFLPRNGRWCSYVWDFLKKVISVLDPCLQQSSVDKMEWEHDETMDLLHQALFDCKDAWIQGWEVDRHNWKFNHPIALGRRCRDYNSGVYTMHYALHYDADDVTDLSVEADHVLVRADQFYQLLTIPGNDGDLPAFLPMLAG